MARVRVDERRSAIRRRWHAVPRPLRFLVVGGVNTLFGYGAYALLLLAGLGYVAAAFLATVVGVLFNYFTTGGLVFEHMSRKALVRFVLVYALSYAINVVCVGLLGRAGLNAYVAGLVLVLPMAVLTYFLMRHIVFGAPRVAH